MAWRRTEEITDIIRKRRWSEAEARLVVSASPARGKSVLSLAREYGLQPSRIGRWSGRLQEESTAGRRFHPVRRVEPEPLDPRPGSMEGVLLQGRRVRIPPGWVAEDWCACRRFGKGGCHAEATFLGPDLPCGASGRRAARFGRLGGREAEAAGRPAPWPPFRLPEPAEKPDQGAGGGANRLRAFEQAAGARDVGLTDAAGARARSRRGRRGRVWADAGRSGCARGAAPPPWVPEPSPGTGPGARGVGGPLTP